MRGHSPGITEATPHTGTPTTDVLLKTSLFNLVSMACYLFRPTPLISLIVELILRILADLITKHFVSISPNDTWL